jgi:DMSO/TMAO reductase YedYZ molybdopterin-dependent catalytic subunit
MRNAAMLRLFFPAVVAISAAALAQEKPRLATTQVEISGEVKRKLSLSVEDLRALAAKKGGAVAAKSVPGDRPPQYQTYVGVRIADVLDEAGIQKEERHAMRRTYVVATASDGYKAIFSWGELFNTPIGQGVLVVYERDGAALDEGEGRIALVSLADDRVGPRHVKWLQRIEVKRVPE